MESIAGLLGTEHPIIMGALGTLAGPELIAAVSEAGGLGLISTIAMDAEILREIIYSVKEKTDKPFGANLMALNPNSPELIEVLADEGIKVVTTSAGSPKKLTGTLEKAGITALHVVPSPALAAKSEAAGVGGIVAEGSESGGMQSPDSISTLSLVPQVVDMVQIPVVAAGGIYDGRGFAAAFVLGAKGVQLGTRLIMTEECGAHPEYKRALIEAEPEDTVVLPMQVGPIRALKNQFVLDLEGLDDEERKQKVTRAWSQYTETAIEEDAENTLVMTGQCAGAISKILPAGEVIRSMAAEGEAILSASG